MAPMSPHQIEQAGAANRAIAEQAGTIARPKSTPSGGEL